MVLRSVGYQSVPLPGVPFDRRASVVPNAQGRVLGEDGAPLPGEYVAGWLKRGPTGVIGTNKSDAAETVRCLLEDLAGGPGEGDVPLPRAGLLRYPDRPVPAADPVVQAADPGAADADGQWPLAGVASGSSCTMPKPSGPPAAPRANSAVWISISTQNASPSREIRAANGAAHLLRAVTPPIGGLSTRNVERALPWQPVD